MPPTSSAAAPTTPATPTRVPLSVWVLAATIFVLGTSEFVVAGLLPVIADDLGVTVPRAGLLISGFAIAMVVGAPLLAVATLRLPRRVTLLAALAVFTAGNAFAALSPGYGSLLAGRVVTAVATGGFWAVAAVVTVTAAGDGMRARALAILVGGLTVSNIVGVPFGTFVGQQLGWRATFWVVAALAALAAPAVWFAVREPARPRQPARLRAETAAFRRGRLWLALGTTALYQSGVIALFSYVVPLLTDVAGLAKGAVPVVLVGFGLANLVGIQVGGRFADRYPWRTLLLGFVGTIVVLTAIAVTADLRHATTPLVLVLGVVAFSVAAPLNARVFALAGTAPTLASAVNASAFNVGNTLGPWLGGLVITVGLGYAAPAWVGALLLVGALALGLTSRQFDRRHEPAAVDPYQDAPGRPCLQGES